MSEPLPFRRRVQRWLRTRGIALASLRHAGWRYFDFPPHSAFESTLLRAFPDLHGLNFVQIGANDGRLADPLVKFIEPCGWSGLMVEPLPAQFAALQRLHGGNPRLRLLNAAVDAAAGRRTIYDVQPDLPNLPGWARGLASFDRAHVATTLRELGYDENAVVAREIATIPWAEVWREFGGRRCDLVVIDTEGYDITLLRLAGLAEHRPRLIHFEHRFAALDERFAFYRELVELGYDLATYEGDTTASLAVAPG